MGKNACGNELAPGVMRRLPCYLNYLKGIPSGSGYISSATVASALGYGDVQVRKDLAQISGRGKRMDGYYEHSRDVEKYPSCWHSVDRQP